MEQSDHMTPRVFSLMWMMSHPGSLVKQFIHTISEIFLMMQMVFQSLVSAKQSNHLTPRISLLMWMVSHPDSLAEQFLFVNEDGVPSWVTFLIVADGVPSWSWHQKCKRRREFKSIRYISNLVPQDPGHSTRNARGVLIFW